LSALQLLGFEIVRTGNHISLAATGPGSSRRTMTLPNQRIIKGSTLQTACRMADVDRSDFLAAYLRS
jgi:hypothetical protein